MSIRMDIKRTDFYNDLPPCKQKEYFNLSQQKFLPATDNIYYNIFIENDETGNKQTEGLLHYLEGLKNTASSLHEPQPFIFGHMQEEVREYYQKHYPDLLLKFLVPPDNILKDLTSDICGVLTDELDVKSTGVHHYKYCITKPDLYDIFIADYLRNPDTPRIHVQIRAFGLWTQDPLDMITESFNVSQAIFETFSLKISKTGENRIDYCYHTNAIHNPDKLFSEVNLKKNLKTRLTKKFSVEEIEHLSKDDPDWEEGALNFRKSYLSLGDRSSNNYYLRIYNKAEEVIEHGYKGFFFDIWHKNMLISFYDKYCYEYAYKEKSFNARFKAMLMFAMEYGSGELRVESGELKDCTGEVAPVLFSIPETILNEIRLTLHDPTSTDNDFKRLAKAYMPELTTIINIEFQTMRKYYRPSDEFIDIQPIITTKTEKGITIPHQLHRLVRIFENRATFIEWLTRGGVRFVEDNRIKPINKDGIPTNKAVIDNDILDKDGASGGYKYLNFWKRLRNTKLKDSLAPLGLIREYNHHLNQNATLHKLINQAEIYAAQNEIFDKSISDCVTDMLSSINDNHKHSFNDDLQKRQNTFAPNIQKRHRKIKNRLAKARALLAEMDAIIETDIVKATTQTATQTAISPSATLASSIRSCTTVSITRDVMNTLDAELTTRPAQTIQNLITCKICGEKATDTHFPVIFGSKRYGVCRPCIKEEAGFKFLIGELTKE